jgi:hypothetical protein
MKFDSKKKLCAFYLSLFIFVPQRAIATFIDFNALSFSDKFTTAGNSSISRTQSDIGIGFDITKSKQLVLAIASGSTNLADTAQVTTLFVASDLGLKLIYFWNKGRNFSTGLTYSFISTAKYNDGTSEVELRGSSIKADLGYNFWLVESFAVSLKLFYYSSTYKESVLNNLITDVSYNRTLTYPSFGLVYAY